ncbi:MAG: DNA-deoxyinosine glycosylase [Clostridiales bacterium]|nr:DNA-deoxyinosine glycosylase [Clostridiales bacterium]MDY3747244.1 DNA-deoxyinosine glycosylase [Lachnospiraceae bacterium]
MEHVIHEIAPVYNEESRVLVLGSFPSVKSRESRFFYGHPQNRFWKVLSALANEPLPLSIEDKRAFLLRNHIAVWDVIASCDIEGSSDSSIKNVKVNDICKILEEADIRQIYCNGAKSFNLYKKYCEPITGKSAVKLPSTSPANAASGMDKLIAAWKCVMTECV